MEYSTYSTTVVEDLFFKETEKVKLEAAPMTFVHILDILRVTKLCHDRNLKAEKVFEILSSKETTTKSCCRTFINRS
jgi:hypothetical protein